jgi:hypothetical protein
MDESQTANQGNANPIPGGEYLEETMPVSEQQPAENSEGQGELPEEVSERTKLEFEKLKAKNKEIAEKLAKYEGSQSSSSVFDYLSGQVPEGTPNLTDTQVSDIASRFVDQYGNVNIDKLNEALTSADKRAAKAEQLAAQAMNQISRSEQQRQVEEAFKVYPYLDPNGDQFDQKAYDLLQDRYTRYYAMGKSKSVKSMADEVAEVYKPVNVDKAKEEAVNQYKEGQGKKAQASTVQKGTGSRNTSLSYDELRTRTQSGDTKALDERLANL